MLDVLHDELLQTEEGGLVVHQGDVDDTVGDLHVCLPPQVLQHNVGDGVLVELDDYAHSVPVGLVPQVGDALDLLVLYAVGDLHDQHGLVDLIGDLVHDDPGLTVVHVLEVDLGPYPELSLSGLVC